MQLKKEIKRFFSAKSHHTDSDRNFLLDMLQEKERLFAHGQKEQALLWVKTIALHHDALRGHQNSKQTLRANLVFDYKNGQVNLKQQIDKLNHSINVIHELLHSRSLIEELPDDLHLQEEDEYIKNYVKCRQEYEETAPSLMDFENTAKTTLIEIRNEILEKWPLDCCFKGHNQSLVDKLFKIVNQDKKWSSVELVSLIEEIDSMAIAGFKKNIDKNNTYSQFFMQVMIKINILCLMIFEKEETHQLNVAHT